MAREILPAVGVLIGPNFGPKTKFEALLKSRALRIAESKTAVSEQRCDSKDVNNCIELRSTGESAF